MATHDVIIFDLAFNPQTLDIGVGDTVQWLNNDPLIYTLWFVNTSDHSTYLLSDPILPGESWAWTFNEPVMLQYYCFERLWITGFINVQYGNHDVAVTGVTLYKTVVGQGYENRIYATVENFGDYDETFDVTAYANKTLIETKVVFLPSGGSADLTFTWDTTGFVFKGVYRISVNATQVPGEVNINNNNFTNGYVKVTIPGDINGDFYVDISDGTLVGLYWMQLSPPAPANVDITGDGIIDISDGTQIGLNWLKDP